MNVLILGGTGQLGRGLARDLRDWGHAVIVTGRSQPANLPVGLAFQAFDAVRDDLAGLPQAEVCINAIGLLGHRRESIYRHLHETLVHRLAQRWPGYLIQISALGARPDHPVRFLRARGRGEEALLSRNRGVALLRPSVVLTPGTPLLRNLASMAQLARCFSRYPLPDGGKVMLQPVAAEDLSATVQALVTRQPEQMILDVVGPTPYSLAQLAEFACRAHGTRARAQSFPKQLALPLAWMGALAGGRRLSPEHLRLLDGNNTASAAPLTWFLGRSPLPIEAFLLDPKYYTA